MKKFCVLTVVLWASLAGPTPLSAQILFDGVAAIVHEDVITVGEIRELAEPIFQAIERQLFDKPQLQDRKMEEAARDALNQLIERRLILHEYKTAGMSLPESIIDRQIEGKIKERYGNRANLIKSLSAMGMTFESWKREERERILVNAVRNHYVSMDKVLVSPFKIENFYSLNKTNFFDEEKVELRLIRLDKKAGNNVEAVRQLAKDIITQLEAGKTFSDLANQYHADRQKQPGGEYGSIKRNDFFKELSDVAFTLQPGKHSGAIEGPESIFIIQVKEKKPAGIKPVVEVREQIEKVLVEQIMAQMQTNWIGRLRKKTYVGIY